MTHHSCNPPSCYLLLPSEIRYEGNCQISLTAHTVKYQTNRRFFLGKQARYGIKCWVMTDTRNCFVSWFCVYTGRDANVVADMPLSTRGVLAGRRLREHSPSSIRRQLLHITCPVHVVDGAQHICMRHGYEGHSWTGWIGKKNGVFGSHLGSCDLNNTIIFSFL